MALTVTSNQSELDSLIANLQAAVDAVNTFELKYSVVSETTVAPTPEPETSPETPAEEEIPPTA